MNLRVLVVDDTVVFRKAVTDALTAIPGVEVVGSASNGKLALAKIAELRPDLVTLDIEMPEMSGLEVLQQLKARKSDCGVVVVSALTIKGSRATIQALEFGAFDFITKPVSSGMDESREKVKAMLQPIVKAFGSRRQIQSMLRATTGGGSTPAAPVTALPRPAVSTVQRRPSLMPGAKPEMVLIGISTGGPNALSVVLPKLPKDLGVPVLVVQHMPPIFTQSLATNLASKCALRVKEAEEGELATAGTVYIAPGGRQMKLMLGAAGEKRIRITDDPPESNCRPSVDYLFRSVANQWPGKATSVIMTGMGADGTLGLRLLKRHGGTVIAQDEASCVVFGMPKEAIAAGVVDIIAPLNDIASEIIGAVRGYPVTANHSAPLATAGVH